MNKKQLQAEIRSKFPEKIQFYSHDLCPFCTEVRDGVCQYELLPVTSNGSPCPYYSGIPQQA